MTGHQSSISTICLTALCTLLSKTDGTSIMVSTWSCSCCSRHQWWLT